VCLYRDQSLLFHYQIHQNLLIAILYRGSSFVFVWHLVLEYSVTAEQRAALVLAVA